MTSGEGKLSGIEMVIVPISTVPEADSVTAFSSREQQDQEREIIVKKLTSMMKNLYGLNEDQVVIKFKGNDHVAICILVTEGQGETLEKLPDKGGSGDPGHHRYRPDPVADQSRSVTIVYTTGTAIPPPGA